MSNCLIWALRQWFKKGGYLIIRRSYFGWWPHFLWSADLVTFWEFNPAKKENQRSPPILFRGQVRGFKRRIK